MNRGDFLRLGLLAPLARPFGREAPAAPMPEPVPATIPVQMPPPWYEYAITEGTTTTTYTVTVRYDPDSGWGAWRNGDLLDGTGTA